VTVLAYCCRVQLLLLEVNVRAYQRDLHLADQGRASLAVSRALEGNETKALELAEDVAERWTLPV